MWYEAYVADILKYETVFLDRVKTTMIMLIEKEKESIQGCPGIVKKKYNFKFADVKEFNERRNNFKSEGVLTIIRLMVEGCNLMTPQSGRSYSFGWNY